jgi:hypothetical protein
MKKNDVWNEEINPDFISDTLENLNTDVWDRGYYKETDDGIWYEVYVVDQIKKKFPKIDLNNQDQNKIFEKFHDLKLDYYMSDNQITFFSPKKNNQNYLDILTNILI